MSATPRRPGGIIHVYRKYDPQRFPMPAAEPPDVLSPAFEHLLAYGRYRPLTPAELADAIELDPRQITGLGPSLDALRAMLEERKRRILAQYETGAARRAAEAAWQRAVRAARPPKHLRGPFEAAVRSEQTLDLERVWYRVDQRSDFGRQLVQITARLNDRDEVEELASKYAFTGHTPLTVAKALEVKEELETIDRLLKQLEEAARTARVAVIDLEALARFADEEQMAELEGLARRVQELLRQEAERQGLLEWEGRLELTPKAYRLFQGKLLDQIFSELQAAKSGRHHVELSGDGAVELQRTKPYEFGDSLANLDVPASLVNALVRELRETPPAARASVGPPGRVRLTPDDLEIHLTRNTPKCATAVLMDMSGSMRWGGAYIHVKRMALALHGLICREYPGDAVFFFEVATLAKRRHVAEIVDLLPHPVTIHDPVVRLRADLGDPHFSELLLPPHFTNIQHGLRLARQTLQVQDTPNRQIILITDGLPTAHFEDRHLLMLYPPADRTAEHTLREGRQCRMQGITLNTFLVSSWSQSEEDVRFAHELAESTRGRVFFVSGGELERFVVWDYVQRRRRIIG